MVVTYFDNKETYPFSDSDITCLGLAAQFSHTLALEFFCFVLFVCFILDKLVYFLVVRCVCVCVIYMFPMWVWKSEASVWGLPQFAFPLIFETVWHSRNLQGSFCHGPSPSSSGIIYTCLHTQLLHGCSEMQTQVLMLTQKILYWPSHLCSQGPSQGETTRCAKWLGLNWWSLHLSYRL